ncbi:MAG: YiiX/YebB-like N1pC/P60 family cysteine hydrolase [Planctomycetota bacterium]|jgi:hypothetical protein
MYSGSVETAESSSEFRYDWRKSGGMERRHLSGAFLMPLALLVILMAISSAADGAEGKAEGGTMSSLHAVTQLLAEDVQTGTLLVSEGDCLAVQAYTQSPYTHVGAVVVRNGQPFVYDACKSSGVRCQTLANYLKSQIETEVHVLYPCKTFTDGRAGQFGRRLDSQLGRPYAVRHHVTGESVDGVHCSEYVSDALACCGLIRVQKAANVSPASLVLGVTRSRVYRPAQTVKISRSQAPEPRAATWYGRLWQDTRTCTSDCYRQTRAWFVCD